MAHFTNGEVVELSVSELFLDTEIQSRARGVAQTVVDEYATAMKRGDLFPAVDIFCDDEGHNFVADGFHRVHAARVAGVKIKCCIHLGDRRAAILFAAGANSKHGLKRTNADKRRAIMMLLADPEWRERSNQWISIACGVSDLTVATVRKENGFSQDKFVARDGRIRPRKVDRASERFLELTREPITFAELLEKMNVVPSALRKMIENARHHGHTINVDTTPTLSDRQEHRLRAEIRDLNAAKKHLLDELESRERQIETLSALNAAPPIKIVAKRGIGEGKRRQGVPVMMLSDLHVEEPVSPEKVNGLNEYNLDIADRCIDRCAEAFEWFTADKRWDMRTGILAILGDTYSGYIHAELEEANFLSPIKAVLWVQERLERLIRNILKNTQLEKLIVVCKDGNHGRTTQKIRAATRTDNSLEWLMYKTLAARFPDEPRVEFIVEEGLYTYVDVYDETLGITHGDQFQYQGGVGGLLIPVRRGLGQVRLYKPGTRRPIVYIMGHFHEEKDEDDVVINGSAIGITPWSLSKGFKPEPRSQHWFLIDSSRGKKAPRAPIWLPLK